ncbi:restriction endonuclease [Ammoniphilus resinae]|uniref:Restriction system protein n=1 Tax=Ammoniphilus resinae TaxID=861532 RepID=A0ABS4GYB0_9BACL|nr:restriction endonuclease [Ammoniphilus resinae]MBP1934870.1 restriction system protein [Ammoniphilus resinae]
MGSIIIMLLIAGGFYYVWFIKNKHRKEVNSIMSRVGNLFSVRDDLHKTLLIGIYNRFKKEEGKTEDTPYDFERFVAQVMETNLNGSAEVTRGSNDGGIDIRHFRDDGLYLGQVKCYAPNDIVNYVPIAVLHSQMVKQGAKGGFVVTTSSYNENAVEYAKGLGIELINGDQFIELWVNAMEKTRESFIPIEIGEI